MTQMLLADSVSNDQLVRILRSALYDPSVDADGDVRIEDSGLKSFVAIKKPHIRFFSAFRLKAENGDRRRRLAAANALNSEYIYVAASLLESQPTLLLQYHLFIGGGGVPERNLVTAFKRFVSILRPAATEHLGPFLD